MPDIFFRTFIYGAAAVALGTGAFIIADRGASLEKEAGAMHAAAPSPAAVIQHGNLGVQPVAMSVAPELPAAAVFAHMRDDSRAVRPSAHVPATVTPGSPAVREPVISFGRDVVEITVPVNPQNGQTAYVPIALALAADPAGVPQAIQEAAQVMAQDFLNNVADAAAVATGPHSAEYFRSWQAAADWSDREFKMRYGRVAYVQMNQLLVQEAAAGIR